MVSVRSGKGRAKQVLIRSATSSDVSVLSHVLARAFQHDPAHRWIFPAESAWAQNSHRRFEGLLKQALRQGIVTTTERLQGAALWISPQARQLLWEVLSGTMLTVRLVGFRTPLVLQGLKAIEKTYPDSPHWCLPILGVDPGQQGRGIGSMLLQPVLKRCDAEQVVASLVSSKETNVSFYERQGFVAVGEFKLPKGPKLWTMIRYPR